MPLNNQGVKQKIKSEIKKIETDENGNKTYQNLRDVTKAVLRSF